MANQEANNNPAFLEYVYQLNKGKELTEALALSLQAINDIDIAQFNRIGLKIYEKDKWAKIHMRMNSLLSNW